MPRRNPAKPLVKPYPLTTKKLRAAFKALRDAGLFARQSYKCCSGCACAAAVTEAVGARGVVFYHKQDAESLTGERPSPRLMIRFAALQGAPRGTAAKIARETVTALREHGLVASWSRKISDCIMVDLPDSEAA